MAVVLVFYGEDCRLCSLAQDLGAHSFITGNYSSWVLFNLGLSVGVYLVQEVDRDIKGGAKFSSFLQGSPTKRRSFDVRPAKYEFSFGGDLFKNAAPETLDEENVNKLCVVILQNKKKLREIDRKMVSLHSTYSGSGIEHGHNHNYKKTRRKKFQTRIPDLDLLTRTSWTDAEIARQQISKVSI